MEEDIKILEDYIYNKKETMKEQLVKAIEHLIKAYKEKDKDNNDLKRLYRRTAIKLKENGKEELADYFLAQINEVPTFTVDDDIDYYTCYYELKQKNKELEKYKYLYQKALYNTIKSDRELLNKKSELEKKDKESHFIQSELDITNDKIIELNKIIDEMANEIQKENKNFCWKSINEIKQYFIKKVEG